MSDLRGDIDDFVKKMESVKEEENSIKNDFIGKVKDSQINSFLKYEREKLIRERHRFAIISMWTVIVLYSIVVFFFIWLNDKIF